MVPAELWKWKYKKVIFQKMRNLKTSWCHCGELGNMIFSPNLTDITNAQYRGQMICSFNAHLHFNALVENNSAYVPKCIFKSFKFKFYLLPVPSKPCNVHYFSPVLFKVLKFDLRSFHANWQCRGTLSEIKKWYSVHRSFVLSNPYEKCVNHFITIFQRIIRFLFASIEEV